VTDLDQRLTRWREATDVLCAPDALVSRLRRDAARATPRRRRFPFARWALAASLAGGGFLAGWWLKSTPPPLPPPPPEAAAPSPPAPTPIPPRPAPEVLPPSPAPVIASTRPLPPPEQSAPERGAGRAPTPPTEVTLADESWEDGLVNRGAPGALVPSGLGSPEAERGVEQFLAGDLAGARASFESCDRAGTSWCKITLGELVTFQAAYAWLSAHPPSLRNPFDRSQLRLAVMMDDALTRGRGGAIARPWRQLLAREAHQLAERADRDGHPSRALQQASRARALDPADRAYADLEARLEQRPRALLAQATGAEPSQAIALFREVIELTPGTSPLHREAQARLDLQSDASPDGGLPDPASAAKDVYDAKCKACHGPEGEGNTKVGRKEHIPDLGSLGWKLQHPDAEVRKTISEGSTKPGSKMKAFKDRLTPEEIDALVHYLHRLVTRP